MGAVDYVSKPFHLPLLKARVETHIQLKNKSKQLEQLALIDILTDLPNHQNFLDTLSKEWTRCQRISTPVSVILLDIDHFKEFNDSYGNPAGDTCLKQLAKSFSDYLRRPGDIISRYEGEQFAAILPGTDAKGALKIANDLQLTIIF